jgi:predicted transcriptional regulator
MMYNMKQVLGFRLTEQAIRLLDAMAQANGISRTAVLEMAIRDAAKKQGIHADSGVQGSTQRPPEKGD